MANWYSRDVQTSGIRTHYYRTGGDKLVLILLHGATDDGLCWIRLARALEADYDIIMPDARGHGLSDAPLEDYSTPSRAADVAGLIEALHLDRPAVAGHSMGAVTALQLAADYPSLLRCTILEDPVFRLTANPPPVAEREALASRTLQLMNERKALGRDGLIAHCRTQNPAWSEEEFGPWADAKLRVSPNFAGRRVVDNWPWRELLTEVRCPILLITGDNDRGAIVSPEAAAEAQRIQPLVNVVHLSGAGHNIRREQFDSYVQAVRSFLVSSYSSS